MLDVNCGIYVDSGPQKLLHILVPLRVAAAGRITVSQLIHQNKLRLPGQRFIQVKLLQHYALIRHFLTWHLLQAV